MHLKIEIRTLCNFQSSWTCTSSDRNWHTKLLLVLLKRQNLKIKRYILNSSSLGFDIQFLSARINILLDWLDDVRYPVISIFIFTFFSTNSWVETCASWLLGCRWCDYSNLFNASFGSNIFYAVAYYLIPPVSRTSHHTSVVCLLLYITPDWWR